MRSRSPLLLVAVTAVVAALLGWFAARQLGGGHHHAGGGAGERRIAFYQSPMHPWIKSDGPGACTICGMALAPVYEGDAGFDASAGVVNLGEAAANVIGVATSPVEERTLIRSLRVTGVLDDDETRHRVLAARVPGRVETLHVNEVGADVTAGQPLVTLYSPEVLTAARRFIELIVAGDNAFTASERSAARERLLELGLTDDEIAAIERDRQPTATVTVRAPFGGTIVSRGTYVGAYVEPRDPLFEIGDFSHLWFIFDATEADLALLEVGQEVEITTPAAPDGAVTAPITFIDPNLDETTRTARVRVVVPNEDRRFRHRQTATGSVRIPIGPTLAVPRSAVLFTRARPQVYVERAERTYESRPVQLGPAGDHHHAIRSGLRVGERVVTRAALIIDAQAQLAESAAGPAAATDHGHGATDVAMHAPAAAEAADLPADYVLLAADAAAALAADDLTAYAALVPALRAQVAATGAARARLAPLADALVAGPDLTAARTPFEPFSTTLADLANAAGLQRAGTVHIFQCPMTPVLGTGRWVQRSADLRNPFFGSDMLTCGDPVANLDPAQP